MLPVKEYTVAKEKYGSFKEKRKKAHDKVQELDARNKPVTEFREYVALFSLHFSCIPSSKARNLLIYLTAGS